MAKSISAVPFKRMMLVDEMMLQKLKEDAITGYNATAKTLAQHKDAMDSVLLAPQPGSQLADERRLALLAANDQRFHQLLKHATVGREGVSAVAPVAAGASTMVQTDPVQTTAQGTETEDAATGGEEQPYTSSLPVGPTLAKHFQIPAQYERKFNNLVDIIAANPHVVTVSPDNELVVQGKVYKGTSFADLMRNLFVDSGSPSSGMTHLVTGLTHLGITEDMLSSKRSKETLRGVLNLSGKTKAEAVKPESKKETAEAGSGQKQQGHGRVKNRLPPGKSARLLLLYK